MTVNAKSPEADAAEEGLTRAAFERSFAEARPVLRSVAGAVTRSPAMVDDIVQEAAMIALGKLDTFDPATSFTAWMSQIVRFVALNTARRAARQARRTVHPSAIDDAPSRPARARQGTSQFDDHVLHALGQLEETARTCLLLRTVHDLPYRQIADILQIPEGTAMSHVHRARQSMRAFLIARGEAGDD